MEKKLFLLVFSLFCAGIVNAAILNVPAEYSSIQAGIDASSNGDTVLVQPGMYVENINYNGKNITVASLFLTTQDTSYISQTVIDGDSGDTVVKFQNEEDSTAVLCGFTITNGWAVLWGGGIYTMGSSPKITHNYICNNYVNYLMGVGEGGGGIHCTGGSPLIYDNKIFNNVVENGYGGGIQCLSSSPVIKNTEIYNNYSEEEEFLGGGICYYDSSEINIVDCNIHDNIAKDGAGIYCDNSGGKIKNSIIDDNDIFDPYTGCGGGVYCKGNSELIFSDATISNHCYDGQSEYGGGIYCSNSDMEFYNCEFINNYSSFGGGIYCINNSLVKCENSYFNENYGGCNGGCFYCDSSHVQINNSIIEQSDAFSYGGAMYVLSNSYVSMDSVSLLGNVASVGGGINIHNSSLDIYESYLCQNSACDGGAIINYNTNINIYNSLFVRNGTYEGGSAIDAYSSSNVICSNVTFTKNYAQTSCGGIRCSSSSTFNLYNSILWNDTQPEIIGNNVSVMYCDIQRGWTGMGNIETDPLFADTVSRDYRLTENSPCIDAGTSDTTGLNIPPWDMDFNKRVWDGNGDGIAIIDMGAYEYNSPSYSVHEPDVPQESFIYNFPNPTQNFTTIQYSLKQNSHVKISIYNIKGQLISTLVNEDQAKGEHSVVYNTDTLNSGVYFYKIKSDDISEMGKMIVIK